MAHGHHFVLQGEGFPTEPPPWRRAVLAGPRESPRRLQGNSLTSGAQVNGRSGGL
jgi:hypothetical protein